MLLQEYSFKEHMKMEREDAREEALVEGEIIGMTKGKALGKALGKAEAVLELLEEYGQPSELLKKVISEQKDIGILKKWLQYAAHSNSIEEFENKIKFTELSKDK